MPTGFMGVRNQALVDIDPKKVAANIGRKWTDLVNGTISAVTAPGRAYGGMYDLLVDPNTGENYYGGMADDARNLSGLLTLGSGAIPKPSGSLGIFGGKMAATADKAALAQAEKMAASGANRDDIWSATGWFKGPDDQWRFEIPDNKSAINTNAAAFGETATPVGLGNALKHDKLYDAYSDLPTMPVTMKMRAGAVEGSYAPPRTVGNRLIEGFGIEAPTKRDLHSVALHETQHAVQTREGFARGASPSEYERGPMFSKEANALKDDLTKSVYGGKLIPTQPAELIDLLKYADPKEVEAIVKSHGFASVEEATTFLKLEDELRTPFSQYRRTSGEVEARNVQTRMNMTAAERRAKAPWLTQDVPYERQIVRK